MAENSVETICKYKPVIVQLTERE